MQSLFHSIAQKTITLYMAISAFLGWTTPSNTQAPIPNSIEEVSSTSPRFKNEATSTIVVNKPKPLPYLKIIAPEFKFIAINRPVTARPSVTPTPTPSSWPSHEATTSPTPIVESTPKPIVTLAQTQTADKNVVVNVLCTIRSGNSLTMVTGSGVVISSSGVILTNSHVAQYVLLADYLADANRNCEVRTGAIAKSAYNVHVLYISPLWVKNNASNLKDTHPQGTGEYDYALLVVENGEKNIPSNFSHIELRLPDLREGDPVTAMGYPAGSLDGQGVSRNLRLVSDTTTISKTYSFSYGFSDLLIAQTDAIAQKGSSGGAVIDSQGKLAGLISTSIPDSQTGHTSIAALSTSYIMNDFYANSGKNFASVINDSPTTKWRSFEKETGFSLAKILLSN